MHDEWGINHLQKDPKNYLGHRKFGNTRVQQRYQGGNSQGSWNCNWEKKNSYFSKGERGKKKKWASSLHSHSLTPKPILWLPSLMTRYFVGGQQLIFKLKIYRGLFNPYKRSTISPSKEKKMDIVAISESSLMVICHPSISYSGIGSLGLLLAMPDTLHCSLMQRL